MDRKRKVIPVDSLLQLRQRLDRLPPKSPERAPQIAAIADLYGISTTTVYRALSDVRKPHAAHRADYGNRVFFKQLIWSYSESHAATPKTD